MKCDNSEMLQCDDCDTQEKCCLDCSEGNMCKNICRVQECKKFWDSKSTEKLIQEIASDDSNILNLAVADRLELLQKRISSLEELLAETFMDPEGEFYCPMGCSCNDCRVKDLCDEAEKIMKKAEAATNDK